MADATATDSVVATTLIGSQLSTYNTLINIGFTADESFSAAETFGSNAEGAINFLITNSQTESTTVTDDADTSNRPNEAEYKKTEATQDEFVPFGITDYSRKLMSGFIRRQHGQLDIPNDIHKIIMKYFNFLFIKLRYDMNEPTNEDSLMILHTNQTLRSIALSIEEQCDYKYDPENKDINLPWFTVKFPTYIRLWIRFFVLKPIYPIDKKIKVSMAEIDEQINIEYQDKWVEIPADYDKKCVNDLIQIINKFTLINEYVLELVVEKFDAHNKKWLFEQQYADKQNWREHLEIGDIIDVMDEQEKWYEGVVRYIYPHGRRKRYKEQSYVYFHYIGWNIKWDEKLKINHKRIEKRGTHTRSAYKPSKTTSHLKWNWSLFNKIIQ